MKFYMSSMKTLLTILRPKCVNSGPLYLPFEEACLNFWETERAVKTPSSEQVRQPIFKSGVENWQNFEVHLSPLKQALGKTLHEFLPQT